jgi:hypothetical protein
VTSRAGRRSEPGGLRAGLLGGEASRLSLIHVLRPGWETAQRQVRPVRSQFFSFSVSISVAPFVLSAALLPVRVGAPAVLCSVGRGHGPMDAAPRGSLGCPCAATETSSTGPSRQPPGAATFPSPLLSVFRPGRAAFPSEDAYAIRARLKPRAPRRDSRTSAMDAGRVSTTACTSSHLGPDPLCIEQPAYR